MEFPRGSSVDTAAMKFGKLEIDPVNNPAVLDTATEDPESTWYII